MYWQDTSIKADLQIFSGNFDGYDAPFEMCIDVNRRKTSCELAGQLKWSLINKLNSLTQFKNSTYGFRRSL